MEWINIIFFIVLVGTLCRSEEVSDEEEEKTDKELSDDQESIDDKEGIEGERVEDNLIDVDKGIAKSRRRSLENI